MNTDPRWKWGGWLSICVALAMASPGFAQNRQQVIQLQAGWNAVFLEVEPLQTSPLTVFSNTPIDIVARYFPRTSPVQYITDPGEATWNEPGWGVWYAPSRPESIVSSLHAIRGSKAYLVHSPTAFSWEVTGEATFERISWQADSFNLLGFNVDEQSPPNFGRVFAGAEGRIGQRIYRLDAGGKWQPVTFPAATAIRSGEAYWVYCRGKTDYQGPLEVKVPGLGGLDFGSAGSRLNVEFFNPGAEPASVRVEVVPGGDLPLARAVPDLSVLKTSYPELQPITQLAVGPNQVEALRLEVRREAMSAGTQTRLLKITTGDGLRYWLPVRAQRSDLVLQP